ncbi:DUF6910 family protein [Nocardioides taihuensis]|uniref:DUF6910 family protein n=1 Tax=Nocardioides taihuensis TaxID=1835606 RepID=A0ABW0BMT5_9ACTN
MDVSLESVTALRYPDGAPVTAASAVAPFRGGLLVVSDDATRACWWHDGAGRAVRVLPAVEGHDTFREDEGTKELKPDLEAAVPVPGGVLLLGSGSTPARTRSSLVAEADASYVVAELAPLHAAVATALGLRPDQLNLEGACLVDGDLRWFQRGLPSAGVPTASVDVDAAALLAAARGAGDPAEVAVGAVRRYDLGEAGGVGLAVTDALALRGGRILVSAAAEDSADAYADGPVVGSALALLDGEQVLEVCDLPALDAGVTKVEGLAPLERLPDGLLVAATVDDDDPDRPSRLLRLRLRW